MCSIECITTKSSSRDQPFFINLLVTLTNLIFFLNIRRKNPNRFPKVFKNSHHIIIYIYIYLFFILLFYDIYIYIFLLPIFRSYNN
jgi:glucan phosphoethanolaminetransferase (alkaline phosphatase superfamily)